MTYSPEGSPIEETQHEDMDESSFGEAAESKIENITEADDMARPNPEFWESVAPISEVAEEGFDNSIPPEWLAAISSERGGSVQIESAPETLE